jgi:hypothetical protein
MKEQQLETKEQLATAFDELRKGLENMLQHAERGETQPIVDGLPECLAAIEEIRLVMSGILLDRLSDT